MTILPRKLLGINYTLTWCSWVSNIKTRNPIMFRQRSSCRGYLILSLCFISSGEPFSKILLTVGNITSNSATASWRLVPTPIYEVHIHALFWVTYPNRELKFQVTSLHQKSFYLKDLESYASYSVHLTVGPKIPGVPKDLSSRIVSFKTLAKGLYKLFSHK